MDLGASGWQTFRYVTFPTISTALISGGLLAFALSFDEVIVTTFTAGAQNTLPIWIFGQDPARSAAAAGERRRVPDPRRHDRPGCAGTAPHERGADHSDRVSSSASSAAVGSYFPAAPFARTWSGFVAPAITDTTGSVASSPPIATSSSERPWASAHACSCSTRSRSAGEISRPCKRVPAAGGASRDTFPVRSPLASG